MIVPCGVVRDVLPLYVENLAGQDTIALVEAHTRQCEACNQELQALRKPNAFPADTNVLPLAKIQSALHRQRLLIALLSICATLAAAIFALGLLTAPAYIPYSEDLLHITEGADGVLSVTFHHDVSGYDLYVAPAENGDGTHMEIDITAWDSIWSRYIAKNTVRNIPLNPGGEPVSTIYYYDVVRYYADETTGGDIIVYGTNPNPDGGRLSLPRLALAQLLFMALVGVLATGVLLLILRRHARARAILLRIGLLPLAYAASTVLIKGMALSSFAYPRDLGFILALMLALYGAALAVLGLLRRARG